MHRTRYARRLSAPLLDRFDLRLRIDTAGTEVGASSQEVRMWVEIAVERQRSRLAGTHWRRNAHIPAGALETLVPMPAEAREAWVDACRLRRLTGRGAARIRRVARTLADLDDRERTHRRRRRARVLAARGRVVSTDPRAAAAATLASLPLVTAPRMRRLLDEFGDPVHALDAVRAGQRRHASSGAAPRWSRARSRRSGASSPSRRRSRLEIAGPAHPRVGRR